MLEIHNLAAELGLNSIKAYKLDALKSVNNNLLNGNMTQCSSEEKVGQEGDSASFINGFLLSSTTEGKTGKFFFLR